MFYSLMNTPARQERWLEIRKGKTEQNRTKRGKHSERTGESEQETGALALLECSKGLFRVRASSIAGTPHLHLGLPRDPGHSATAPPRQVSRTYVKLRGGPLSPAHRKVCQKTHQRENASNLSCPDQNTGSSHVSGDNIHYSVVSSTQRCCGQSGPLQMVPIYFSIITVLRHHY